MTSSTAVFLIQLQNNVCITREKNPMAPPEVNILFSYQSGNRQGWPVGLTHKQPLQDNFVELGISSPS